MRSAIVGVTWALTAVWVGGCGDGETGEQPAFSTPGPAMVPISGGPGVAPAPGPSNNNMPPGPMAVAPGPMDPGPTAPTDPGPINSMNDSGLPDAMADGGEPMPTADADMEDVDTPPMREDLGEGDGSDVITIGDSWMDYFISGGGIEGALARKGKDYRNYSLSGTRFLNGVIPAQYDRAQRADPNITTVIMTGGGNDILLGGYDCDTPESCQEYVEDLVVGLNELWTKMSGDGVQDVIYINYSAGAGSSPADARPTMRPTPQICIAGPIRCHSLQTTDLVNGDLVDGIHPTRAANDRIAEAVISLMEEQGMRR